MKTPDDLGERGSAFYGEVVATYALRRDELELLAEAARCLDRLDALREEVARHGLVVVDKRGATALNPAAKEERQVRLLLRLLVSQLALPDPESGESAGTRRARSAAQARWQARQAS